MFIEVFRSCGKPAVELRKNTWRDVIATSDSGIVRITLGKKENDIN
jgi:hypothetical protein